MSAVDSDLLGPLITGVLLGALAAAQVGPMWLMCARTSARFGFRSGASLGAGVAFVDVSYAVLGSLGAAALLRITPLRLTVGLGGAAVLIWLGARTIHTALRLRLGAESDEEVIAPKQAFRTAVIATASNPLTILTWGAVFGGAAVADVTGSPERAVAFIVGIGLGSLLLHLSLAAVMSVVGARLTDRGAAIVDAVSGVGLVAFGGLLAYRTITNPE
jgi:putative LysE/RhtB family amino acid efflux pump